VLIDGKADPNFANDTAPFVNRAIERKNLESLKILRTAGAKLTGLAKPPLFAAIDADNAPIVSFLLENGVSASTQVGNTNAKQYAAKKKAKVASLLN
jgi:hypothetical protein